MSLLRPSVYKQHETQNSSAYFPSDDYKRFLTACVENAASQQLAFVKAAYEAHGDTDTIISLDQRCESCLPNHVTNRASQRQVRNGRWGWKLVRTEQISIDTLNS